MSLKDWQARWGDHIPAQAIAELLGILSPVMPSPAPTARHSEAAGALPACATILPCWHASLKLLT